LSKLFDSNVTNVVLETLHSWHIFEANKPYLYILYSLSDLTSTILTSSSQLLCVMLFTKVSPSV